MQKFLNIHDTSKKKINITAESAEYQLKDGEYHILVTGIIMNSKNEILIIQKTKSALKWEFNSGSIRAGETSLEGIIRKLKEELDCYLLGVDNPVEEFEGRCIAVIHRINDNDDKLVIVSNEMQFTDEEIRRLTKFQEQYFESEIIR